MNFNFAQKVVESAGKLTAGIKDATFMGVAFETKTSQKDGNSFKTLALKLDIDGYGPYTQNFFEPQSDERTAMQWGVSASMLDHFLVLVREILEAVDPQIVKDIDSGTKTLTGNFKQICDTIKQWTDPAVGKLKVQIKLVPQSNGYVSMPTFVARITKSGDLGIATRVIGHEITLTSSEIKKIDAANNAKPTTMPSKEADDILGAVSEDLNNSVDDLPFA